MPAYDAGVQVSVTLTYHVLIEVEAATPEEAEEKIRWQALGLTRQDLDRLCDGRGSNQYEGSETTVLEVGQVGPPGWAPEDDDADEADDGGPAPDPPTSGR